MTKLNLQIKCTNCKEELDPITDGLKDGTYTEFCTFCLLPFSYVIKDGELAPWKLPNNVHQSWRGEGDPGGK